MKIIKILVFLLFFTNCFAQDNDITFEHFGTKDGITNNYITAITQDNLGYIWFTTQFGLNKFDGYNFTTYTYDPKNKNTPRGNWMNFLFADQHGKIWIFQGIGGVDCFDTNTETFEHFAYDEKNPNSISEKFFINGYLDKWDNFWLFMANTGINRFNREDKTFIKYSHDARNDSSVSSNQVFGAYADTLNGKKYLWFAAGGFGLNRLDIESNEVKKYKWRNIKADKTLIDFVKANKENRELISIDKVGDAKKINKKFRVEENTKVLIVNIGEGLYNDKYDYGKITNNGNLIWEFDPLKSANAGGELRNRIQFDIIDLKPGNYNLLYQSDSLHSFDKWYKNPPEYLNKWGISLYKITENESDHIKESIKKIEESTSLNSQRVFDVERIGNNLWITTWGGGINKLNILNDEFESFNSTEEEDDNSKKYLRNFWTDSKERLWILNKNYNLLCFDTKKKGYLNLNTTEYDFRKITVNQIIEDLNGGIWVASKNKGLFKISFKGENFLVKNYVNDKLNPKSISGNSISFLKQDNSGNIWVGTNGDGINKFNESKNKFNLITASKTSIPSLSDRYVTSLAEDTDNNIWIATKNGGLNKFIVSQNKIISNFPVLNKAKFQSINTVYFSPPNTLYIGLSYGGIYKYDVFQKSIEKINTGKYSKLFESESVSIITEDNEENLWVGTFGNGAFKVDSKNGNVERFVNDPEDSTSILSNSVWTIYVDKNSDVWIGTATGGISKLIKGTSQFINYDDKKSDPYRFPNQTVECFFEDSKGNFWIGSFSAGLNLLDRETNKFKFFTVKDGLPGNKVSGIVEDKYGNLWLSTNNGISKFNYEGKIFRNYDYADGLQDNEFTRGAYLKSKNGLIFFGGEHGFNYFNPAEIKNNNILPKINLTAFKKYNEEIKFDKPLEKIEQIELGYNDDEISFEFVALDFTSPEKNKYAYKMIGFDKDWVYCGKRRYANYTNLYPGEYVFKVIGTNSDGVWNREGASVIIIVHPPFWQTWWFYLLSVVLFFSAAVSIHRVIVNRKISKTLEYERIRNNERDKVREELSRDFHDELGHKLTRISMFARSLRKKIGDSVPSLSNELNHVSETSQSLYLGAKDLIWALNPGEDTLYDAVIRLKDFGDDLFDKTEIKFSSKGITEEFKKIKLPMEWKRHLVLIFKESMNNILKYAECKNVLLDIDLIETKVKIVLYDDGKGFEVNNGSNGFGLNNIKKRAEKINGIVEIKSNCEDCEKGTKIIFNADIPRLWD